MHRSSLLRMQWFVNEYIPKPIPGKKIKVLDVGSYDVNGSYKNFFPSDQYEYYGLDIEAGPNVDIVVENPYTWRNCETESFDVVISGQAFEHIEFFWVSMAEMARVLKKDGLVCIIAPNGFGEHRHPVDCYRFFTDGMVSLARYVCLEPLHAHTNLGPKGDDNETWYSDLNADAMLIAKKGYAGNTQFVDLTNYKCVPPQHSILSKPLIPSNPNNKTLITRIKRKLKRLLA